jgi:hypothetical protein
MINDGAGLDKVRAVAFTIDGKVYVGKAGESHITLYLRLLQDILVPAVTLDVWTSDDNNHGFVTDRGDFINRAEAFRRFGTTRSQDLKAQGVLQTVQ